MTDLDQPATDGRLWIVAMGTLCIAQPLYDLLGSMPDYFLVRGLGTSDVWLFGLLAFLLPPAVLVGLAELLAVVRLRDAAYRVFTAALAALGALLFVGTADHAWRSTEISGWLYTFAAILAAVGFHRLLAEDSTVRGHGATRHVLRLLAVLAPLAPLLFFLRPEIRGELTTPLRLPAELAPYTESSAETPPAIVLVLDELPLFTLLDPKGGIDAELFPHLAGLADTATWYRGATTPRFFTQHAVPALVAGRVGSLQQRASVSGYPANLLTLLRGSHHVVSDEPITAFDPDRPLAPRAQRLRAMAANSAQMLAHAALPPTWAAALPRPSVRETIGRPAGPTERFDAFLQRLEREAGEASRPLLVFSHLLLPHHPWLRDERGQLYDAGDEVLIAGIESPQIGAIHAKWQDDWEAVLDAYERHVLQTRHADQLVGRLLDLLRRHDLFDRSLIVVASDHGIHFEPDARLRQRTDDNAHSLEQVPLLVKLPGQRQAFLDDSARSTLDVLPTVLDVLGLNGQQRERLDLTGSSLLRPPTQTTVTPATEPGYRELRDRWLARRIAAGPAGFGPWHEQVAGRELRIGGVPTRDWVAELDQVERLESVSPHLPPPRRLSGRLLPRNPEALSKLIEAEEALPLGVGIDGMMVATTLSSEAREGDEHLEFSVLLPAAVPPGEHQVVLYLLAFQDDTPLPPLPIPRVFARIPNLDGVGPAQRGEARAVRFHGVTAPVEIFGWLPAEPATGAPWILRGDEVLAEARWFERGDIGLRYGLDDAPAEARRFHAVVPAAAGSAEKALRVVASLEDGGAIELKLTVTDESVFRITGPFRLRFDPRDPPPAYQNY